MSEESQFEKASPVRKPAEQWAAEKTIVAWTFAAARYAERWPHGQELTETEFDQALERARSIEVR